MNKLQVSLVALSAALVVSACTGAATPAPTQDAALAPITDFGAVVAEGRLEPDRTALLSFQSGGQVAEILVSEGQTVKAGDVLAQLSNGESLAAQVAQAKQAVLDAQNAVKTLNESVDITRAQIEEQITATRKALERAERTLRNTSAPDIAYYEDQLKKAQDSYQTAVENAEITDIGDVGNSLQAAKDNLQTWTNALNDVNAELQKYPGADMVFAAAIGTFIKPADAQKNYDDAVEAVRVWELRYEQAQRGNAQTLKDLQEAVDDAQANLNGAKSPKDLDVEVAQAEVDLLTAQIADAELKLSKLANGPDPDQLALAEARVEAAQAQLAAAEAALTNSQIMAPIDGTVVEVAIKVGEMASPGARAITVAALDSWVVKTNNLTEIDVVRLEVGQAVEVVLDALPDTPLQGTIREISQTFTDNRGDVTYEVTVSLTEVEPRARWGMTAQVTVNP
ncbi:MAG: efflux RND transporter periplasmic adaptor subunit [Anaerolineales bacterium]|nr:efflux RND transporter periplasmic adaptor subunit [Anaerolineales bacterium]